MTTNAASHFYVKFISLCSILFTVMLVKLLIGLIFMHSRIAFSYSCGWDEPENYLESRRDWNIPPACAPLFARRTRLPLKLLTDGSKGTGWRDVEGETCVIHLGLWIWLLFFALHYWMDARFQEEMEFILSTSVYLSASFSLPNGDQRNAEGNRGR